MTTHLVNACQEIDDLLLECLLTWSDEAARQDRNSHRTPVHVYYVKRSGRLIEARSAIEAAIHALGAASTAEVRGMGENQTGAFVSKTEIPDRPGYHSNEKPHAERHSLGGDTSTSRPDRPQRPQERCRGQLRDWNRDILACRPDPEAWSGHAPCGCRQPHSNGYHHEMKPTCGVEEAAEYAPAYPADNHFEADLEAQQRDEAFGKELENGAQGKSTRSRKRG